MDRWYDEVTLRDVAEGSGVALQTAVNHFATKEGLLAAMLQDPRAQAESEAREGRPQQATHMRLPISVARDAIDKGWSELHPVARRGAAPPLVMLYGPRDEAELDTVWQLVQTSYAFARGQAG